MVQGTIKRMRVGQQKLRLGSGTRKVLSMVRFSCTWLEKGRWEINLEPKILVN